MFTDLMIDLEYLADTERAVITQIAAVPFDITNGFYAGMEDQTPQVLFNEMPKIKDQLELGRVIDEETMLWWMNQIANNGRMPVWADDATGDLETILDHLYMWGMGTFDWKTIRIWSRDMIKLQSAYQDVGMHIPWDRGNIDHLQTLKHLAIEKDARLYTQLKMLKEEKTHDAVDDCVIQIKQAALCWETLYG